MRELQQAFAARLPRRPNLQLRVHVLRDMRRENSRKRLPQLRRRLLRTPGQTLEELEGRQLCGSQAAQRAREAPPRESGRASCILCENQDDPASREIAYRTPSPAYVVAASPTPQRETWGNTVYADLLLEVVTRRYDARKAILLSTNKAFAEWSDVFPHAACVVRLVDRLIHRAEVIDIESDSYRLEEAKELNECPPRETPAAFGGHDGRRATKRVDLIVPALGVHYKRDY